MPSRTPDDAPAAPRASRKRASAQADEPARRPRASRVDRGAEPDATDDERRPQPARATRGERGPMSRPRVAAGNPRPKAERKPRAERTPRDGGKKRPQGRRPPRTGGVGPAVAVARTPAVPRLRRLWRAMLLLRRAPGFVQAALLLALLAVLVPASNWLYQVARKPSELFFPVSDALFKTPRETWATYAPLFHAHATALMTPELLAALAQAEASGNPVARTYWRWSWTLNPFEIYRPASSAVGMYQITDGTFDEARRYCVRGHRVAREGPWHDWDSCWFNGLYTRVLPSHAIEMTSANLDHRVHEILARRGIRRASLRQKQDLAIVTHLCGAGAAARFAARGLRPAPGQHCGDHDLARYLARVHGLANTFARLRRGG